MQYSVQGIFLLLLHGTFSLSPCFSRCIFSPLFSFYNFVYCRCCEYALLILEYWADAPEIQRAADLYEDFIRCCVADAMSEVFYIGDSSFVWCCICKTCFQHVSTVMDVCWYYHFFLHGAECAHVCLFLFLKYVELLPPPDEHGWKRSAHVKFFFLFFFYFKFPLSFLYFLPFFLLFIL